MRRIETIQALRFAAAGLVVLCHCASGYFLAGSSGVDIFFVISGFIMTRLAMTKSASNFAADRFTRVYPVYWLWLLPLVFTAEYWSLPRLLTSFTLWPYFGELNVPFLVVGWTLCYEMLFYAGTGLVLWRRWMLPLLGLGYLSALLGSLMGLHPILGFLGNPLILEFAMGSLIAIIPATQFRRIGAAAIGAGAIAIPIFADPVFGETANFFRPNLRPLAWGIPAAAIVWGALQWEGRFKGWTWALLLAGGDASYAIYLSHPTFLLFAPSNPYLLLLAGPPVLVLLGLLVHRWIERPLTRWSRRRLLSARGIGSGLVAEEGLEPPTRGL